jgi:hypothetical protein
MDLTTYLQSQEAHYHPQLHLLGEVWNGPGYHSRIPNGTWVHPTRTALDYALALLRSDESAHHQRAADVIASVLTFQETDPVSATYGIWPWLAEESLAEMSPPDWNWADFCGMRLALALADHTAKLPPALVTAMRASLGHAAWSIFRRNVRPGYTNIAVMGAGVALAAGELLGEARLLDYGRGRLRRVVEYTAQHGGFNEYNSPTYTAVVLHECENILHLVADAQSRTDAEALRRLAWETIADHFHPATGQWAGPHSRTYSDRIPASLCRYLSDQTGVEIVPHPSAPVGGTELPSPYHLPCPPALIPRFQALPETEVVVERRFTAGKDAETTVSGTTWLTGDACLGSVNHDCFWTQRPAVVLRLRFLKDGQDFSGAYVRNRQEGPRILSAVNLLSDRGDFHLSLDRPADGVYRASDLRLRYELTGTGCTVEELQSGVFALVAGAYRGIIQTAPGRFGPHPIRWEMGVEEGQVYLDAVCYSGPVWSFTPAAVGDVVLAAGLELLGTGQSVTSSPVTIAESAPGFVTVRWAGVVQSIEAPLQAHAYPL